MINGVLLISFFLDGLLSIYQGHTFFHILAIRPMFTIVALVLIYPFLIKDRYRYFRLCAFTGLAYDLIYTNTLVLNVLMFVLLGLIIEHLYSFFSDTLLNSLFINIIVITLYHVLTFFVLALIGYISFSVATLSSGLFSMIITNTVFFVLVYSSIQTLRDKRKKRSRYSL